ncbi:MAG TPA: hypothetical protein VEI97_06085, partial [bacterium]|nr:hypothetical protein [bacterium]
MAVAQSGTSRRPRRHLHRRRSVALPLLPPEQGSIVIGLDHPSATHPIIAGRKASNLATALSTGFAVLPGFVITTQGSSCIEQVGGAHHLPAEVEA